MGHPGLHDDRRAGVLPAEGRRRPGWFADDTASAGPGVLRLEKFRSAQTLGRIDPASNGRK